MDLFAPLDTLNGTMLYAVVPLMQQIPDRCGAVQGGRIACNVTVRGIEYTVPIDARGFATLRLPFNVSRNEVWLSRPFCVLTCGFVVQLNRDRVGFACHGSCVRPLLWSSCGFETPRFGECTCPGSGGLPADVCRLVLCSAFAPASRRLVLVL